MGRNRKWWVTVALVALFWIGLFMSMQGCATGANMREAEVTITLPPGMTATATVDAEGKGVPAVQINIGNTTRTVVVETAREATVPSSALGL